MSSRKIVGLTALLLLAVALGIVLIRTPEGETKPSSLGKTSAPAQSFQTARPAAPSAAAGARPDLLSDPARATVLPRTSDGFVDWPASIPASKNLNNPAQTAAEDIAIVRTLLDDYRSVYKEAPPGSENVEITRVLLGDNPKRIRFLMPEKTLLDQNGALIDRWGEPYFFHRLSRITLDIRSSGADRKMYTSDDQLDESPGERPPL